jgi:hypothetical protein
MEFVLIYCFLPLSVALLLNARGWKDQSKNQNHTNALIASVEDVAPLIMPIKKSPAAFSSVVECL